MNSVALMVLAKEPLPGRAKTRLSPPCTPSQAAALAQASLLDTLAVVARTPAPRKVLVFEGDARRWRQQGFEVMPQRGTGLGERLAAAFEAVKDPALLVGMDTPQLTTELLLDGIHALARPDVDAVLGRALDGGYWSVGLKRGGARAFAGIPMSSPTTCAISARGFASSACASTNSPPCATSTRSRTPTPSLARHPNRASRRPSR